MNGDGNFNKLSIFNGINGSSKSLLHQHQQQQQHTNSTSFIEKVFLDNYLFPNSLINNNNNVNGKRSNISHHHHQQNKPSSSSSSSSSARCKYYLDEAQLKRLNSVFSNLTFETISNANDRFIFERLKRKQNNLATTVKRQKQLYMRNNNNNTPQQTTAAPPTTNGNTNKRAESEFKLSTNDTQILDTIGSEFDSNNNNIKKLVKLSKQSPEQNLKKLNLDESNRVITSRENNFSRSELNSSSTTSLSSADTGASLDISTNNQLVIHVCDEAKRIKQDFTCPRDLLVREMKYFSYNLNINVSNSIYHNSNNKSVPHAHSSIPASALSKKSLEEIDISVHCDINIFDWLMRYVKRNHPHLIDKTAGSPPNFYELIVSGKIKSIEPKLEVANCVSILLSSDFLIMGDLVDKCIVFIAQNLEAVLQIQCVFNGINEQIMSKLAACVPVTKLDTVYDRKDKLKTKLFQRKIEFLFDNKKYRSIFKNSVVLKRWLNGKFNDQVNETQNNDNERKIVRQRDQQSEKDDNNSSSQDNDSLDTKNNSNNNDGKNSSQSSLSLNENEHHNNGTINENYLNFLYECENNSSSLFKCKICSRFMTKKQSIYIKCQLAILNSHGEYIYLHVPDEKFDLTNLLQLLKEKLKSWQSVYWFVWALSKAFKCKKCNCWFRLVEYNKCRLNDKTFCTMHDTKISNSTQITTNTNTNSRVSFYLNGNKNCTCIHCNHEFDATNLLSFYSDSPIVKENPIGSGFKTKEQKLNKFFKYITDSFEKYKEIILTGRLSSSNNNDETDTSDAKSFCDQIEEILTISDKFKYPNGITSSISLNNLPQTNSNTNTNGTNSTNGRNTRFLSRPIERPETSSFMDSLTGKHISLLSKHMLNLIKLTQMGINISNGPDLQHSHSQNQLISTNNNNNSANNSNNNNSNNSSNGFYNFIGTNFDLRACLNIMHQIDIRNVFNSLDVLQFLKVDNKVRWDTLKPTRLNQDNQREDDLKKFREISNYLIRAKLIDELQRSQKSIIAFSLLQQLNNQNNLNSFTGGIYCRVEYEWKQRRNN